MIYRNADTTGIVFMQPLNDEDAIMLFFGIAASKLQAPTLVAANTKQSYNYLARLTDEGDFIEKNKPTNFQVNFSKEGDKFYCEVKSDIYNGKVTISEVVQEGTEYTIKAVTPSGDRLVLSKIDEDDSLLLLTTNFDSYALSKKKID